MALLSDLRIFKTLIRPGDIACPGPGYQWKDKRKNRSVICVLSPHDAFVLGNDHAADRQTEPAPGSVVASGIGRVLLKNLLQASLGDKRAGIEDIEAIGIRLVGFLPPP